MPAINPDEVTRPLATDSRYRRSLDQVMSPVTATVAGLEAEIALQKGKQQSG